MTKKKLEQVISEDPKDYGSRGENWDREFVRYMKFIVTHTAYEDMPDAVNEDGKIQWEAPSNRSSGKYQFTHQRRRDWWEKKALTIGINPNNKEWISKTAKAIHPTHQKPCKRCGRVFRIDYVYPSANLIKRIKKYFGDGFEVSKFESIDNIIRKINDLYGSVGINRISEILSTSSLISPTVNGDIGKLLKWVEAVYIPSEPSLLSPGAMSNAPDRFDGFHSFNICCRGSADKGRSLSNLSTYTTDRRVFEYWSEGDWIAADRLMGIIHSDFSDLPTDDGGGGGATADHIGPLSLGFCHRPAFRLLSKEANSAKNNRMDLRDIRDLLRIERTGKKVISWYGERLWNLRKKYVDNDEKALRLSKMLRDNQRNAMVLLSRLYEEGLYSFLIYLLDLNYADYNVEFRNLRVENYLTIFDRLNRTRRENKYASEQKARRIRIGFDSLRAYTEKENRHMLIFNEESMESTIAKVSRLLKQSNIRIQRLDHEINVILTYSDDKLDFALRSFVIENPSLEYREFIIAKQIIKEEMNRLAKNISGLWESDRYVRSSF